VAAQARLRYKFTKTSLDLTYQRFLTSGSGLFAGAQSNLVRLSASRPLSRVWSAFTDMGYSHNSRVQPLSLEQLTQCNSSQSSGSTCPANDAIFNNSWFAGAGVHRAFGREFHAYGSYQFNVLAFDHSYCGGLPACNRISNRNVLTFGLDWTPRPIRID
jgi:long-subunit fatty acid transport protein